MSLTARLRYHAMVDVVGKAVLRKQRLELQRKLARPRHHEHLGPPLRTAGWLKELISRHYLKGQYAEGARPVAWVTSGAPVEPFIALGFFVLYPENHAAVCGIRRTAQELCETAEEAGYSRDICSYARTDIGSVLSGSTPVGRLPRPDLLVCCTNICQTVLSWYQVLAHHFDVPLVLIDTPFLYTDEAPEHAVSYVQAQLEEAIARAEEVARKELTDQALRQTTRLSKEAVHLWMQVLDTGRHRPTPLTAFDAFIQLAPIVEMRGEPFTVDYYAALLAELKERSAQGISALKHEQHRVLWDNLPIWGRMRWLSEALAERGVALVASTYTQAWGELAELIDPEHPISSAAKVYLYPILNRGTGHKLAAMKQMAERYEVAGVILHSDRSCKPYSIGQVDQREALSTYAGLPALLLEADHNDPRAFSEEQVLTRLDAFVELLEG